MGLFEDIGGAVGGATSAVDKFLGGTGGEQVTQEQQMQHMEALEGSGATDTSGIQQVEQYVPSTDVLGPVQGPDYISQAKDVVSTNEIVTHSEPVIASVDGDYDLVGSGATKEERHVSEDSITTPIRGTPSSSITRTPEGKVDISKYYKDVEGITSEAYTPIKDLGDTRTQELIAQGYTPEQALISQKTAAEQSGNVRASDYYQMELRKASVSRLGLEGEYDVTSTDSGVPTERNPFEGTAELSKNILDTIESGGSNKSLLGLTNAQAMVERGGILKQLSGSTAVEGGVARTLSLSEQQDITRDASKSSGLEINESALKKTEALSALAPSFGYGIGGAKTIGLPESGFEWTKNKELLGGKTTSDMLGIDTITGVSESRGVTPSYKESLVDVSSVEPTELVNTQQIREGTKEVSSQSGESTISSDIVPKVVGGLTGSNIGGGIGTLFGPGGTLSGALIGAGTGVAISGKSDKESSFGNILDSITKGSKGTGKYGSATLGENPNIGEYTPLGVVKSDKLAQNIDLSRFSNRVSKSESKLSNEVEDLSRGSYIDKQLVKTGSPTLGRSASSLGGTRLEDILVPLTVPRSSSGVAGTGWALGEARRSKHSSPSLKRKVQKPKPKQFSLESIHNNMSSKSFDAGLVKFQPTTLESAVRAIGSSKIKSGINITKKSNNSNININNKKHDILHNIANVVEGITRSTKIKKVKSK